MLLFRSRMFVILLHYWCVVYSIQCDRLQPEWSSIESAPPHRTASKCRKAHRDDLQRKGYIWRNNKQNTQKNTNRMERTNVTTLKRDNTWVRRVLYVHHRRGAIDDWQSFLCALTVLWREFYLRVFCVFAMTKKSCFPLKWKWMRQRSVSNGIELKIGLNGMNLPKNGKVDCECECVCGLCVAYDMYVWRWRALCIWVNPVSIRLPRRMSSVCFMVRIRPDEMLQSMRFGDERLANL